MKKIQSCNGDMVRREEAGRMAQVINDLDSQKCRPTNNYRGLVLSSKLWRRRRKELNYSL